MAVNQDELARAIAATRTTFDDCREHGFVGAVERLTLVCDAAEKYAAERKRAEEAEDRCSELLRQNTRVLVDAYNYKVEADHLSAELAKAIKVVEYLMAAWGKGEEPDWTEALNFLSEQGIRPAENK